MQDLFFNIIKCHNHLSKNKNKMSNICLILSLLFWFHLFKIWQSPMSTLFPVYRCAFVLCNVS